MIKKAIIEKIIPVALLIVLAYTIYEILLIFLNLENAMKAGIMAAFITMAGWLYGKKKDYDLKLIDHKKEFYEELIGFLLDAPYTMHKMSEDQLMKKILYFKKKILI